MTAQKIFEESTNFTYVVDPINLSLRIILQLLGDAPPPPRLLSCTLVSTNNIISIVISNIIVPVIL